jgi:SsrA-binding protein
MKKKQKNPNSILRIKKVDFEYERISSYKAGLKLEGWMVKAIRAKRISSSDGVYIKIINNQPFMMGLNIKKMIQTNTFTTTSEQPTIKLLLNKYEIKELQKGQEEKGFTVVLNELFWEKHLIKASISLVRGLKTHDKRQQMKEKSMKLDADRAIKNARV